MLNKLYAIYRFVSKQEWCEYYDMETFFVLYNSIQAILFQSMHALNSGVTCGNFASPQT